MKQYTIKANKEMMKLLSSGIYKDKIFAVIRELATNAIDIVEQHDGEAKIILKTIKGKHWFIVSDTGVGLSKDETIRLMSTYGDSTKLDNEDVNGMFGIGSKSPFAYTNEFYIKAIKDSEANYFKCFKDEEGTPCITHLKTENTDEPSGLEYRIEIFNINRDIGQFIHDSYVFTAIQEIGTRISCEFDLELDKELFQDRSVYGLSNLNHSIILKTSVSPQMIKIDEINCYSKKKLNRVIYNSKQKLAVACNEDYAYEYSLQMWFGKQTYFKDLSNSALDRYNWYKIGNMYYIDKNKVVEDDDQNIISNYLRTNCIFEFNPKQISVTGSREEIEETVKNNNAINIVINEVVTKFKAIRNKYNSESTINLFLDRNELFKITNFIEDGLMYISRTSSNSFLLKNSEDEGIVKEISYNVNDKTCLRIDVNEEFWKNIDENRFDNRTRKQSVIKIEQNKTKLVICEFNRNGIDLEKMIEDLGTRNISFVNTSDIVAALQYKKIKNFLLKYSDKLGIDITTLDSEDRKQFARTRTKNVTKKVAAKLSVYGFDENNFSGKIVSTNINDVDESKYTLYAYRHRNDIMIVQNASSVGDSTSTTYENRWLSTSLYRIFKLDSERVQLVLFNKKQEAVKYFSKYDTEYKLHDVVIKFIKEQLSKNKEFNLIMSLIADQPKRRVFDKLHSLFKNDNYIRIRKQYFEGAEIQHISDIIDTITYSTHRDPEFLEEIKDFMNEDSKLNVTKHLLNLVTFCQVNYSEYGSSPDKIDVFTSTWELYKSIYIDKKIPSDLVDNINIFKNNLLFKEI